MTITTNGWTCASCGQYVQAGIVHYCDCYTAGYMQCPSCGMIYQADSSHACTGGNQPLTYTWGNYDPAIAQLLERLANAVEKLTNDLIPAIDRLNDTLMQLVGNHPDACAFCGRIDSCDCFTDLELTGDETDE